MFDWTILKYQRSNGVERPISSATAAAAAALPAAAAGGTAAATGTSAAQQQQQQLQSSQQLQSLQQQQQLLADRGSGQLRQDSSAQKQQQYRRVEGAPDPYSQGRQQLTPSRSPPMDPRQQQQQSQSQRQQLAITASAQQQPPLQQQSPQPPAEKAKPARKVGVRLGRSRSQGMHAGVACARCSVSCMLVSVVTLLCVCVLFLSRGSTLQVMRCSSAQACVLVVLCCTLQSIWARFRS